MTTQQTDADLIHQCEDEASICEDAGYTVSASLLRRAAARLSELTQPAPLALSRDNAEMWAARVNQARCSVAPTGVDEAILAVDALLRKRVQRLTDDDPIAAEMTAVADQYAHRMAMHLECILLDYSGQWYDEAIETLSHYRADMNAIHERLSPTHMGEPVIEDRSDCHGPDWTDRDGEYLK